MRPVVSTAQLPSVRGEQPKLGFADLSNGGLMLPANADPALQMSSLSYAELSVGGEASMDQTLVVPFGKRGGSVSVPVEVKKGMSAMEVLQAIDTAITTSPIVQDALKRYNEAQQRTGGTSRLITKSHHPVSRGPDTAALWIATEFRYPAPTPPRAPDTTDLGEFPRISWSRSQGGETLRQTGETHIVGDTLVTGVHRHQDHDLYAFDLAAGDLLGHQAIEGLSSIEPGNGAVYYTADGELFGFDPKAQKELWRSDLVGAHANPDLEDDVVYAIDQGTIRGFHPETGSEVLSVSVGDTLFRGGRIIGDKLLFGREDGSVAALNRKTGEKIWETPVSTYGYAPRWAVADGRLVARNYKTGALISLDIETGKVKWTNTQFEWGKDYDVFGRYLLARAGNSTEIACLDLETNQVKWSRKMDGGYLVEGRTTVFNDFRSEGDDAYSVLRGIDNETGMPLPWALDLGKNVWSDEVLKDGLLYVTTIDRANEIDGKPREELLVLDARTGAQQSRVNLTGVDSTNGVDNFRVTAIEGNRVIVESDGSIACVELDPSAVQ